MRIAHISDLHVLALDGAFPFRLLNKRATGYANLRFRRKHVHKSELVRAIAAHLSSSKVDHVVVSGDVTNLALEAEFDAVRRILDEDLALGPGAVTLVPGNHDVYTRGAERGRRFHRHFEPYLASDLPSYQTEHPGGPFPVVKLRGPVALIGLSTALARPPFFASGRLGAPQLDALERILRSPELTGRLPILVQHHPIDNPSTWMKSRLEGLDDAPELSELLATLPRALLLHGHLHRRVHHEITTRGGRLDVIGATSASLVHASAARMAGFNLYEISESGAVADLRSYVYDAVRASFGVTPLPPRAA